jgi:hypothetical protein
MNKTLKAADEVKKLHRMFQSLGEVVEVLERVGSLEQAENEAQARIDKLNAEAEAVKAASDLVRVEADRILAEANTFAEDLKAEAGSMRAKASAHADAVLMNARKEAAEIEVQVQKRIAQAELAEGGSKREVEKQRAVLRELEERIADARNQISKLLGS